MNLYIPDEFISQNLDVSISYVTVCDVCACCCMMLKPPGGAVVMLGDSWEEVSMASNVCLIEQKLFRTCSWKFHWVVATQILVYFHPGKLGKIPRI